MSIGTKNFFFGIADSEQNLLDSLIVDATRMYGTDCYYISRNFNNLDNLYGADDSSSYTHAWPLAIYIKNVMGFQGDREFMEKFSGLAIRDQVIFSIPRYTFETCITSDVNFPALPNNIPQEANRPREGDLIFIPFKQLNKCFKITWVNLTDMFFQLEKLYTWEVTCELFEYSDEVFNTGIPMIDRIQMEKSTNILDYLVLDTDNATPVLTTPSGDYWTVDAYNWGRIDPLADNTNVDSESNNYINWNSTNIDPFSDMSNRGGVI